MPSAVGLRRSLGSAVQKLGTKLSVFCLLGGGRRRCSRWESFSYGRTTRRLISSIKLGYCFTRAGED